MKFDVWHGTNQEFTGFDPEKLGLNTYNSASKQAFFFARDVETAWDYAAQASRKLIPQQDLHEKKVSDIFERAQAAEARRDFTQAETLWLEAEELETAALQADPSGARVYHCEITMENPLEVDASEHRVVVNLGAVLDEARKAGHDGVILHDIHDTPSGEGGADIHYAIFDTCQISILDVVMESDAVRYDVMEMS